MMEGPADAGAAASAINDIAMRPIFRLSLNMEALLFLLRHCSGGALLGV
jgi:hypothetical protein